MLSNLFIKKVSVVIPAFQAELFLARCLRSILDQSLPANDYEIIVVDDGSTDNTQAIVSTFGSRVRGLKLDENMGLPAAINFGISEASSNYIVRLDSDDFVNRNFLNFLLVFLELNQDCDAVGCDYSLVDDTEKIIRNANCSEEPIGCGILFKKSQLEEIGLYNAEFRVHEERELRHRFEKKYQIGRLPIPLYRYRKHENNLTNNKEMSDQYERKLENLVNE